MSHTHVLNSSKCYFSFQSYRCNDTVSLNGNYFKKMLIYHIHQCTSAGFLYSATPFPLYIFSDRAQMYSSVGVYDSAAEQQLALGNTFNPS